MGKDNLSGKKKYNNGTIAKYYIPGTQPEGCVLGSTENKKLKNSEATKKLWSDDSYKKSQQLTRASEEYKEQLSNRTKEVWSIKHDEICESLKKSATQRWSSEEECIKQSQRMTQKWETLDYRESQTESLKKGHANIYTVYPEYLKLISIGNSKSWENNKSSILEKQFLTKTKNKTWNSSKLEELFYQNLLLSYSEEEIIRQYSDSRYPFYCDFYIKPIDKFIEIQGTWSHGGHPFDDTNPDDLKALSIWQEKAKTSNYYKNAIKVWTITDPLKIKTAIENNLNIEFIY